ncbi:uncharacterized protein PITG_20354 [Phytophthora infestans T30-4]|uniref:Uncharacterized protein n=1 Tax=Phytophthora infestans (strain T30-4) TaxID=403677 RepID=D0P1Q6_PHYIT|nr:uncharacterized protein PITG_20354 [Phytophthora infestans T30-4]EEY54691.1 hypothetical protein PITG_20354 [Phytophthora infestans T30-4]|eukprot:XP_002895760.1 hypothetical protein PITG_20354 [Phytophthora infestans T30-4]
MGWCAGSGSSVPNLPYKAQEIGRDQGLRTVYARTPLDDKGAWMKRMEPSVGTLRLAWTKKKCRESSVVALGRALDEQGSVSSVEDEMEGVALFTNPQGVWNLYSGTWDVPPGRAWNGKFWAET